MELLEGARDVLTRCTWSFGQLAGPQHCVLQFAGNGAIHGSPHPNETSWRVEPNGDLLFLNPEGAVTTRFTSRSTLGGRHAWLGEYSDGRIVHYLVERFDPDRDDDVSDGVGGLIETQRRIVEGCGFGDDAPGLIDRDRYLAIRRHLRRVASRAVFPSASPRAFERVAYLLDGYQEALAEQGLSRGETFFGSIKDADAATLYQLVTDLRPERAVQIGTFVGFSALLIADALKSSGGGVLTAIDPEIPHRGIMSPVDVARTVARRFDLEAHVRFERGWGSTIIGEDFPVELRRDIPIIGAEVLRRLGDVQLAFIDADHSLSATLADFMLVKEFVAPGGVVVFHDVESWPTVTAALETILTDIHHWRGAGLHWEFDLFSGPDGIAALRRRHEGGAPTLAVHVVDAATRAGIGGAVVTVRGRASVSASSHGEAMIGGEMDDGAELEVSAPGYRPVVLSNLATNGGVRRVSIALDRDG